MLDLQKKLPNARVVYCSATGASSLGNMAYMGRLGLWGPGTAFSGGFAGRGLFFDREHDTAGVGYVYSDVQTAPFATGTLLDMAAQRAELYYTFQFGAATELTLDLQWADSLLGTVDEATVLGFRLRTQF